MAQIYEGSTTDYKGNKLYSQTYSHLIFCPDGETVQDKIERLENETENVGDMERKVNEITDELNSHPEFIYDESGKITGYKTPGGADTVFPFSVTKIEIISNARPMVEIKGSKHGYVVYTAHTSARPKNMQTSANVNLTSLYTRTSTGANVSATQVTYYEFDVTDDDIISFVLEGGYGATNEGYALIVCDK